MADEEKDTGGWMKDLGKDLRLQFHGRLSSPLIGSFVISWLIWNHRLITVLVASMSVQDRFKFIDSTLYPTHLVDPLKEQFHRVRKEGFALADRLRPASDSSPTVKAK